MRRVSLLAGSRLNASFNATSSIVDMQWRSWHGDARFMVFTSILVGRLPGVGTRKLGGDNYHQVSGLIRGYCLYGDGGRQWRNPKYSLGSGEFDFTGLSYCGSIVVKKSSYIVRSPTFLLS